MKRFLLLTVVLTLMLAGGFSLPSFARAQQAGGIPVLLDGLPVAFDVAPVIQNGRTLVPFRAIAEALNVPVTWEAATRTVRASDGRITVLLQVDSPVAWVNDRQHALEVPPQIVDGRTLVPIRFFGEAFNCKVDWLGPVAGIRIASPPKEMTVLGFYTLGDQRTSSWTDLFGVAYPNTSTGSTDLVGEIALGWYSVDATGALLTRSRTGWQRPEGWEDVLDAAGKYGLKTEMVVHATDGDGTLTALLSDEAAVNQAVREIAAEAKAHYRGVNIDFEGLGWNDTGEQLKLVRDRFTRFIQLLADQLHRAGYSLTLSLHPPNSAYLGYDYDALGKAADRIVIMAYDYGTVPEPVEPVARAVEMAKAAVPPGKMLLGISVPGETAESIVIKVGIAKRHGLDGIALWRLGLVSDEMWDALRTTVKTRGS